MTGQQLTPQQLQEQTMFQELINEYLETNEDRSVYQEQALNQLSSMNPTEAIQEIRETTPEALPYLRSQNDFAKMPEQLKIQAVKEMTDKIYEEMVKC